MDSFPPSPALFLQASGPFPLRFDPSLCDTGLLFRIKLRGEGRAVASLSLEGMAPTASPLAPPPAAPTSSGQGLGRRRSGPQLPSPQGPEGPRLRPQMGPVQWRSSLCLQKNAHFLLRGLGGWLTPSAWALPAQWVRGGWRDWNFTFSETADSAAVAATGYASPQRLGFSGPLSPHRERELSGPVRQPRTHLIWQG